MGDIPKGKLRFLRGKGGKNITRGKSWLLTLNLHGTRIQRRSGKRPLKLVFHLSLSADQLFKSPDAGSSTVHADLDESKVQAVFWNANPGWINKNQTLIIPHLFFVRVFFIVNFIADDHLGAHLIGQVASASKASSCRLGREPENQTSQNGGVPRDSSQKFVLYEVSLLKSVEHHSEIPRSTTPIVRPLARAMEQGRKQISCRLSSTTIQFQISL